MSEVNNSNKKKYYKRRRPKKNNNEVKAKNSDEANKTHNRNRRPKALSPTKLSQKYDNLLEQYLIARKKYFEMYARAKGQALTKISNNYTRTLKAVFTFKDGLNEWQKESLDKKLELYPEDNQYSKEHDLSLEGEIEIESDQIEDIHLTDIQKSTSYKDDTEESSGSMDDYKKYKDSVV